MNSSFLLVLFIVFCFPYFSGACNLDEIEYESGCYNISTMEATNLEYSTTVYKFFEYYPYFREGNNLQFTFQLTEPSQSPCTTMKIYGVYTCDYAICSFDTLMSYRDLTVDNANPYLSLTIDSNTSSCGCDGTEAGVLRILADSDQQDCSIIFEVTNTDPCNFHGTYVNTTYCECDIGYLGDHCEEEIPQVTYGEEMNVTVLSTSYQLLSFVKPTGWSDITIEVLSNEDNDASCLTDSVVRAGYTCGGCNPGIPAYNADTGKWSSVYNWELTGNMTNMTVSGKVARSKCGCSGTNSTQTWFIYVDNSNVNTECSYTLLVDKEYVCPASCSGKGQCSEDLCVCDEGRSLLDCSKGSLEEKELFNGVVFGRKFYPRANQPFNTYMRVSLTNSEFSLKLTPFSGSSELFSALVKNLNASDIGFPGQIHLFAKFGEYPTVPMIYTPQEYPRVVAQIDESNLDYDFRAEGIDFEYVYKMDNRTLDQLSINVYVTIVSTGVFDSLTSKPINGSDVRFLLSASIEDKYATKVDAVLMGLFSFIVFFFLVAWKACPFCFHGIMRRVVPEFYEIQLKNRNVEVIRQKFANQLSKYVKGIQVPGMIGFSSILILMIPPNVKLPNLKQNIPLQEMLDELEALFSRLQLPVVTIPEFPQAVLPQVLLRNIIAEIPKYQLTVPVTLPPNPIPDDLLHIAELRLPNVTEFQMNMISLKDVVDFLKLKVSVPEIDLLQDLIDSIPAALIPTMIIPKDLNIKNLLDEIEFNINHIVGFPKLKNFSIYSLLPLNLFNDIDLTELIPKDIPVVSIGFEALHIEAISPELLTNLHVPVPVAPTVQVPAITLFGKFVFGTLFILISNLLHILVEGIYLLFNVAIVWRSMVDLPYVTLPTIIDIKISLEDIIGPLSEIVYMIEDFFGYLNFFKAISWNCGGTLTLLTPFVFLFGAVVLYAILQKDIVLYLGIKLGMSNQGKISTFGSTIFKGLSKGMVKVVVLILQVTIFVLAQAATTSNTRRSCNSIDFIGNTFGKIIVAFFYVMFYSMFFFIFTGAPDWDKYSSLGGFKAILLIFVDGIRRFSQLTSGVWTDDTVRGYNIIGRSDRYLDSAPGSSAIRALERVGAIPISGAQPRDSLHEQVMHLIAITRGVVWIPMPLLVVVTKFSEALNSANIFVFTKHQSLVFKRPFALRLFTWIISVFQMPVVMGIVFTASSTLTGLLMGSLIPLFFVKSIAEITALITTLWHTNDAFFANATDETVINLSL